MNRSSEKLFDDVRVMTQKLPTRMQLRLSSKYLRIVGSIFGDGSLLDAIMVFSDEERERLVTDTLGSTRVVVGNEIVELNSWEAINKALPEFVLMIEVLAWVVGFNFFPTGLESLRAKLKGLEEKAMAIAKQSTSPTSQAT